MNTLVITGISRGIGLETAKIFLKNDWLVIGTSTNGRTSLKHQNLKIHPLNLIDSEQINHFAKQLPKIDVLINNAAVLLEDWREEKINMSQLRDTFNINVFGTIELTEQCISKLNPNAQIINISSGWGTFSSNDSASVPHYKMSKSCLNMYTLLLAKRLSGITVSSFDPGWVKTDMGTNNALKLPSETAQEIYDLVQMKKKSGCLWHEGKIRNW
ncbi:SDR family NAD(P)-dependent oxidoreductase [Legionella anisa]|uniref:Short-chain dehydrogenase n=1 Tax=Legionella anisa TaxID=28082 RepID=A0AAX0WUS5_9GAMM|nr:SDR family NAD(P)-dependent oxidoreductase [Legionella anisa]AWN75327.1 short-chain dehydrogenase [Legionella anisa]KTC72690.1 oxidoreductase [Legionella anisa]MBN5935507.1 SDR family NAD(P)-dependent oxidoreductase [Legionella anisa]MCW8424501.1 SDR family NAD(P)-dependent oxidoreductase [Legionella anisa]MCW8446381.1 SDR family NAD(P)-dependent oxidoreductase [Legionella anisa]